MANVKISALPVATTVGGSDLVPIVQGGVTKQATVASIEKNSGLVFITDKTVSGAGDIQINNCFTSEFRDYFYTFDGVTNKATSGDVLGQMCTGGAYNASANYSALLLYAGNGFTWSHYYGGGQTFFQSGGGGNLRSRIHGYIYSPQVAEKTTGNTIGAGWGTSSMNQVQSEWIFDATTQFDGLRLFQASQTMTGTLTIYGLKKG